MRIDFLCPRWGFEKIRWEKFLADVKKEGFTGIEWFPYAVDEDHHAVLKLLRQYELKFAIVMTVIGQFNHFSEYLTALGKQLQALCDIRDHQLSPIHVSAQTGREYYTTDQIEACLRVCSDVSKETAIPIYQETHRNKWTYAAHAVHPFLEKFTDLKLTLDVSHWFCVSESYLEDQAHIVQKAIQHARHIHARVGHIEGPQVWDPMAAEYAQALEEHLKIWDKWIETRIKARADQCTITPEFGPPPYMVFANRKGSPEEEQWRLNCWMRSFLEKRYQGLNKIN
jgi:sugar phosphate isomerase/epimerase